MSRPAGSFFDVFLCQLKMRNESRQFAGAEDGSRLSSPVKDPSSGKHVLEIRSTDDLRTTQDFSPVVHAAPMHNAQASLATKREQWASFSLRFVELLTQARFANASTMYANASVLLTSNPEWADVSETTRRQCFEVLVGQLQTPNHCASQSPWWNHGHL